MVESLKSWLLEFESLRNLAYAETLAGLLGQASRRRSLRYGTPDSAPIPETPPDPQGPETEPSVSMLLDIDAEYRGRATAGSLFVPGRICGRGNR